MSLTSCSPDNQLIRTETVEVQVPVTVPLDKAMTRRTAEPASPDRKCKDANGVRSVCGEDLASYVIALRRWGRAMYNQLGAILAVQPTEKKP